MNLKWQEFLSFYTGINKKRKDFDDQFQQENGIGEEKEDPIGNLTDEELERQERQSIVETGSQQQNETRMYVLNTRQSEELPENNITQPLIMEEEVKK